MRREVYEAYEGHEGTRRVRRLERRPAVFDARGEKIEGYEWTRVGGIPDARCREW